MPGAVQASLHMHFHIHSSKQFTVRSSSYLPIPILTHFLSYKSVILNTAQKGVGSVYLVSLLWKNTFKTCFFHNTFTVLLP